jgi:hypothetical protein
MLYSTRTLVAAVLAVALASCSASQAQSVAPTTGDNAAAMIAHGGVSSPKAHRHRLFGPNDVIGGGPKGLLQILLGDVALPNGENLQAINLGIDGIYVTDASGNSITVAQFTTPQVVNVLAYQNGSTTSVGQGTVPQSTYASLTIVIDTASSNIQYAGGSSAHLNFLVGRQSQSTASFGTSTTTTSYSTGAVAVTFNQPFTTVAGEPQRIDVDFNAFESILLGSWRTVSRPSLTVAAKAFEGSISGTIADTYGEGVSNAVVVATDANGNADATSFTDGNGNFTLHTLSAGTYNLTVYNEYVTASGSYIQAQDATSSADSFGGPSGVSVQAGQTTSVGTIQD